MNPITSFLVFILVAAGLLIGYRENLYFGVALLVLAAIVAAAHEAGYKVLTYTANDPAIVNRLAAWNLDGIITDAIDIVRPE